MPFFIILRQRVKRSVETAFGFRLSALGFKPVAESRELRAVFKHFPRRSFQTRRKNVFRMPLATVLSEAHVTDETGFQQHHVRGL